jgi:hypothetical protein
MYIYFLKLKVVPAKTNEHYNSVEGAFAHCWILEDNPESAYLKAKFQITKYDWEIESIEVHPVETTRNDFIEKDLGLQNYDKAQQDGIAIVYLAWSRDGKTQKGPFEPQPSYKLDMSQYFAERKQFQIKGRCLHYEAGGRCNEFISAHSIQKKGMLAIIAEDGQVYGPSSNYSALKKNKGKVAYQKIGISKMSTFLGFCKKHDNELFEPIDNFPLIPTDQQIFLYGYRSLCKELFVKENSLNLVESQLKVSQNQKAISELFSDLREGNAIGLKNLKMHKVQYDDSLRKKQFEKIKYVLFISNQKPNMAFSGLFYPDYNFIGRHLQDLGNHEVDLELITFCSAPMKSGWGFLFSWHKSSSNVCVEFMKSLATAAYENGSFEDLLFRLIISSCENHAISPCWWEKLSRIQQEQIIEKISRSSDVFVRTPNSYLMEGLEGISGWKFDHVISNME